MAWPRDRESRDSQSGEVCGAVNKGVDWVVRRRLVELARGLPVVTLG